MSRYAARIVVGTAKFRELIDTLPRKSKRDENGNPLVPHEYLGSVPVHVCRDLAPWAAYCWWSDGSVERIC